MTKALEHKAQGNALFQKGQWEAALSEYSKGISCDSQNPELHLNKSAVLLRLERWHEAQDAANYALVLSNGKLVKAWFRRATALMKNGDVYTAYYDLQYVTPILS